VHKMPHYCKARGVVSYTRNATDLE